MSERREIGRVVGSTDQADYLVQVHNPADVPEPPGPHDRAFGQFVEIPVDDDERLVGVISTTQLINPSYGALGPRLSTEQELPVFTPDYLAETATVVGVSILGTARRVDGLTVYEQRTPSVAASAEAPARALPDVEMIAFHRPGGALRLAYFPRLLARPVPTLPDLLCSILDRLIRAFPEDSPRLRVAKQNLLWRATIEGR
jgi:hypothetical protein